MHAGIARPQGGGDLPDRIGFAVERAAGEDEHPLGAKPIGRLGDGLCRGAAKHHAFHSSEDDLARTHAIRGYRPARRRGR